MLGFIWLYSAHQMWPAAFLQVAGTFYLYAVVGVFGIKLVRSIVRSRRGEPAQWPWPPRLSWLAPVLVFILLYPLNGAVLHARFQMSRDALDEAASNYLMAEPDVPSRGRNDPDRMTTGTQTFGSLPVDAVERWPIDRQCGPDCGVRIMFVVDVGSLMNRGGYVYSSVPIEEPLAPAVTSLGGNWYYFR